MSWLALGFGMAHGVLLLGDQVVTFSLAAIVVPFASSYRPLLTGLGILSLYLGAVVSAAFYLKKRLGYRAWRTIHGLSYAMFAAVTVHSILLGADTSTAPMRLIYLLAIASVLYLTTFRILLAKAGKEAVAGVRRAD
jgi:predicted ferric reductase